MIALQEQMPSSVCFLELYLGCMLIFFSSFGILGIQISGKFFHSLFKLEHFNTDQIGNCTATVIPPAKHKHRTPSIQKFPAEIGPKQLQQTMPQL